MKCISNNLFFLLVIIFVIGCKKDVGINSSLDYRSKLEGNYSCLVNEKAYSAATLLTDSTYSKLIKVEVDYLNTNKNSIIIDGTLFTELISNANYYECHDDGTQFKNKHAKLINDSLYYYVVYGTNGAATYYTYKGKK